MTDYIEYILPGLGFKKASRFLSWFELCPLNVSMLMSYATGPQIVALFGDRVFLEIIKKIKSLGWALL